MTWSSERDIKITDSQVDDLSKGEWHPHTPARPGRAVRGLEKVIIMKFSQIALEIFQVSQINIYCKGVFSKSIFLELGK